MSFVSIDEHVAVFFVFREEGTLDQSIDESGAGSLISTMERVRLAGLLAFQSRHKQRKPRKMW